MENFHKSTYMKNAVWLAILTVVELAIVELSIPPLSKVTLLLAFAVTKMILVALVYMHLRYETSFLRRVVVIPIPLAILFTVSLMHDLPFRWVY